jgi:hypothetical protein
MKENQWTMKERLGIKKVINKNNELKERKPTTIISKLKNLKIMNQKLIRNGTYYEE